MLRALFLFSSTAAADDIESYVQTYVLPSLRNAKGFRSLSMNHEPIMSATGRPPYTKVVEAQLDSLDDWIAVGRSELVQSGLPHLPAGTRILFYEIADE